MDTLDSRPGGAELLALSLGSVEKAAPPVADPAGHECGTTGDCRRSNASSRFSFEFTEVPARRQRARCRDVAFDRALQRSTPVGTSIFAEPAGNRRSSRPSTACAGRILLPA